MIDILAGIAREPRRTALCLDFDGTLAPVVVDPFGSMPLPGTTELLDRLAFRFAAVAIVSGRRVDYLLERVAATGVRYVGLHGVEEIVDGQLVVADEAKALAPAMRAAVEALAAHPAVVRSGARVEDKGLATVVHLRHLEDPGRWAPSLAAAANEVTGRYGLELIPGRLVWELRTPVSLDKGTAVRRVVEESGADAIIFMGDDLADLPAFHAVRSLADGGCTGVAVAVHSDEAPPEIIQAADHVVDGPIGVLGLLTELAQLSEAADQPDLACGSRQCPRKADAPHSGEE